MTFRFKMVFKVVRSNSKCIYNGFGFDHLDDVTQYYVHPDNQSPKHKTTLCQPVGEAVGLFSSMIHSVINVDRQTPFGNYWVSPAGDEYFLKIDVPEEYKENEVIEPQVFSYKAYLKGKNIVIAAYDENDSLIQAEMERDPGPLYKLLPILCVLLAREMEQEKQYHDEMEKYSGFSSPGTFIKLNEDFYQRHKTEEYNLEYGNIPNIDISGWKSLSSSYDTIRENQIALQKDDVVEICRFDESEFTDEQKSMIPSLEEEFVLPNKLLPVCNAIQGGDVRATLFHGPAGTGKTISCKLVCQTIGLPVMETINCTENLDEFVLGKFIPQDDKIIFKESYVTKAIREGGAVVFEEINFAKPQYLAFLNSLLDDNGFVRLDNGEVVRRHKNFRFFATMNLGYFGTKELNQALYNRFNAIFEIAELNDEAIKRMLVARVPECQNEVEKIIRVYHKIQKKIEDEELDIVISPRNLENWARLAKYEGYITAAEKSIIPIAKCDRILEEAIRGILMVYKW